MSYRVRAVCLPRFCIALALTTVAQTAAAEAPAPSASVLPLTELAAKATPAVVLLTERDDDDQIVSSGSGFFVSASGKVMTNHHVIEGVRRMKAKLADGRELGVSGVLADSPADDLAVLQVEGSDFPFLVLGTTKGLRVGDEISVIGSPQGLSQTLTTGILSAIREQGLQGHDGKIASTAWTLQFSAVIAPGSSGSPVFARSGEVIGVAVGASAQTAGISFGIRAEAASALLANANGPVKQLYERPPSPTRERLKNLGISAAVALAIAGGVWFSNRQKPAPERRRRR